ncbi:MAG: phosphatase PAP2 family protein [Candidatus Aenigmatarchaeota archaeon]
MFEYVEFLDRLFFSFLNNFDFSSIMFLAFFSYYYFYLIFLVFSLYFYFFEQNKSILSLLILLSLIGFSTIYILKYTIKRERYEGSIIQKIDYSFPSSHSYFATLLILFSIYFVRVPYLKYPIILFSIFEFFSILVLRVHYMSDVIFSIILAVFFFYLFNNYKILDKLLQILRLIKNKILSD